MKRIVNLDDWMGTVQERTKNLKKPKRIFRSISSRSQEESDAIGYAVKRSWENALATGQLKKEADGSYTVCI